jgi:hypothetical protein
MRAPLTNTTTRFQLSIFFLPLPRPQGRLLTFGADRSPGFSSQG